MRRFLKLLGWLGALVLVAVLAGTLHVQRRGGSYPSFPAESFAHLTPAGASDGAAAGDPVVQTEEGALEGARVGSVIAFRGIPYAQAPVGELRSGVRHQSTRVRPVSRRNTSSSVERRTSTATGSSPRACTAAVAASPSSV